MAQGWWCHHTLASALPSAICTEHPSTLELPFKLLKKVRVVCIQVFVRCREVNTFASVGGRARTVSIWDHMVKKQLRQYPKYVLRVQDLAFNVDGSVVGVRDVPTIRLINELTQSQAMSVSGNSTQLYNLIASWDCFSCLDCLAVGRRIAS